MLIEGKGVLKEVLPCGDITLVTNEGDVVVRVPWIFAAQGELLPVDVAGCMAQAVMGDPWGYVPGDNGWLTDYFTARIQATPGATTWYPPDPARIVITPFPLDEQLVFVFPVPDAQMAAALVSGPPEATAAATATSRSGPELLATGSVDLLGMLGCILSLVVMVGVVGFAFRNQLAKLITR